MFCCAISRRNNICQERSPKAWNSCPCFPMLRPPAAPLPATHATHPEVTDNNAANGSRVGSIDSFNPGLLTMVRWVCAPGLLGGQIYAGTARCQAGIRRLGFMANAGWFVHETPSGEGSPELGQKNSATMPPFLAGRGQNVSMKFVYFNEFPCLKELEQLTTANSEYLTPRFGLSLQ